MYATANGIDRKSDFVDEKLRSFLLTKVIVVRRQVVRICLGKRVPCVGEKLPQSLRCGS